MLGQPPLAQHFDRSWLSHTCVKATLYEAETQNQAAISLHSEQEVASEISRIKVRSVTRLCGRWLATPFSPLYSYFSPYSTIHSFPPTSKIPELARQLNLRFQREGSP